LVVLGVEPSARRAEWSPFRHPEEIRAVAARYPPDEAAFDWPLLEGADELICELHARSLDQILDREGLPHVAHLICGWGDEPGLGELLATRIGDFVHQQANGRVSIRQCDPDGDFHPWQTFAYCCMADPQFLHRDCGTGSTILNVAQNSTNLNTSDATDLGHTLFTLASLEPDQRPRTLVFDSKPTSLSILVGLAVEAHRTGGFHVCRKFHLTEGLCALAAEPAGADHASWIREFFAGQIECLAPLDVVTNLATAEESMWTSEGLADLTFLRTRLVLGSALENLFYYAGHLFELAGIAIDRGFRMPRSYHSRIRSIANSLNGELLRSGSLIAFPESFYAFAHYRRGLKLYLAATNSLPSPHELTCRLIRRDVDATELQARRAFTLAPAKPPPAKTFAAVLECYDAEAPAHLLTRGEFPHFRKIMPSPLPRGIHYEFLYVSGQIGVELHWERVDRKDHALLKALATHARAGGLYNIGVDLSWSGGGGRIGVRFSEEADATEVVGAMRTLIRTTFDALVEGLCRHADIP
jgi:hypothetical protein